MDRYLEIMLESLLHRISLVYSDPKSFAVGKAAQLQLLKDLVATFDHYVLESHVCHIDLEGLHFYVPSLLRNIRNADTLDEVDIDLD